MIEIKYEGRILKKVPEDETYSEKIGNKKIKQIQKKYPEIIIYY